MIGDQADVLSRLKGLLPPWFGGGVTPLLDAETSGTAWALSQVYGLYVYAKAQARLTTATDGFLDLAAQDFFGTAQQRRTGEGDGPYRSRLLALLLLEKNTRAAVIKAATQITGRAPTLIEPTRPIDTGAWDEPFYWDTDAYAGAAVAYTSLVIAYRPMIGTPQYGVLDSDIYTAIDAARPAGYKIFVALQN